MCPKKRLLNIFVALCYLQIPFAVIISFDPYSKPLLDMIFIRSNLKMEKNNLFEISKVEPADVGPIHESSDSKPRCFCPYLAASLIQFCGIGMYDSTQNKLAHRAISKL